MYVCMYVFQELKESQTLLDDEELGEIARSDVAKCSREINELEVKMREGERETERQREKKGKGEIHVSNVHASYNYY